MKLHNLHTFQNRPSGTSTPIAGKPTGATASARSTGTAPATPDAKTFRTLGAEASVFAERITTDQFKAKILEAKSAIVDAERFDVAFQERILQDPLLLSAFKGYLSAIMAGTAKANARKKTDAEVVDNRISVMEFLKFFESKLEDMKDLRDSADVDMTQLGLEVIDRNADIQTYLEDPMELVGTMRAMAALPKLEEGAQKSFLQRMAKAAVQSVSIAEHRTPERREEAFRVLTESLGKLVELGTPKSEVSSYFRETTRIAKEIDGEDGKAHQIRAEALFLGSSKATDRKAALAKIEGHVGELVAAADARSAALSQPQMDAFRALVDVARKDPTLFLTVPDRLSRLREAKPAEDGTPYKPHGNEVKLFNELVASFVKSIGQAFPDISDKAAAAGHVEACELAQGLLLETIAANQDQPMSALVEQLTRHADLAEKASEIITDIIQDPGAKLNAAESAIRGFLGNGQLDAAHDLFHDEKVWGAGDDGGNTARQLRIFDKATEVGLSMLEEKGKLEGSEPTQEWVASAYMRGIDVCLEGTKPDLAAVSSILSRLADAKTPLTVEQTEDVVSKFRTKCEENGYPITPFLPGLVGMLAQHADDVGAMNSANELIDRAVDDQGSFQGAQHAPWKGQNMRIELRGPTLSALARISDTEMLSGNVRRLAKAMVDAAPDAGLALAERLPDFGKFANKEELAALVDAQRDEPRAALAFANTLETTKMARDLVVNFVEQHIGTDAADMDPTVRIGMVKMEAALRMAVPNLMTEKAMVGLVRAVQAAKAPRESLRLLKSHAPRDLITKVLEQIDDAHVRDYLSGVSRPKKVAANPPDVGEGIPVNVVEGSAKPPKE